MTTWIWILIAVLCLVAGVALGFYIARRYMMNYLEQNPPINEDMIKTLMMQMGQKPSQKKVNQVMRSMSGSMKNPKN
ncbi:YneF family protein [Exiguobacterium flavidum]|uniref:YneF family protein n=1 Tax=Exiguobacterium flavidum TaxID=2184695 RepID=UPI000DF857D5|nr:YneF family protein [Exiguobacterium flavidum]